MTTSRVQTSERGQGPASVPGDSGSAQSQSKRELPSLEEIGAALSSIRPNMIKMRDGRDSILGLGMAGLDEAALAIQALFSTVGSDSRVRELETERDEWKAAWYALDHDAAALHSRVRELEEALRELLSVASAMPRRTPAPGGCATTHAFQIEAGQVWENDRVCKKVAALLSQPSPTDGETDAK